jgi:hypothetical protein
MVHVLPEHAIGTGHWLDSVQLVWHVPPTHAEVASLHCMQPPPPVPQAAAVLP